MNRWKASASIIFLLIALPITALVLAQDRSLPQTQSSNSNTCLNCHDSPLIHSIEQTVHGQRSIPGSPSALGGCTECHGVSEEHINSLASPDFVFGSGSDRFPASNVDFQNQQCLNCHQSRERVHWAGSLHESAGLACVSCHDIHNPQPQALLTVNIPSLCIGCHQDKRAQLNQRSHHPVLEGVMSCTSCHNPHGSDARSLLVGTDVVDTCTSCHAEKRGPFLWEHQPVTDDCTTCHNPHGTTQASMLSLRPPFLCQSCHSDPFHPSSLYSGTGTPPTGAAQQLLGNSCTNCHSAIHGSNHPSGSRFTR